MIDSPRHNNVLTMHTEPAAVRSLDIGILLRGFASGCAALTGIEAVSNGVQAFKKPEAKNAALTLGILGVILAVMFIGITLESIPKNNLSSAMWARRYCADGSRHSRCEPPPISLNALPVVSFGPLTCRTC